MLYKNWLLWRFWAFGDIFVFNNLTHCILINILDHLPWNIQSFMFIEMIIQNLWINFSRTITEISMQRYTIIKTPTICSYKFKKIIANIQKIDREYSFNSRLNLLWFRIPLYDNLWIQSLSLLLLFSNRLLKFHYFIFQLPYLYLSIIVIFYHIFQLLFALLFYLGSKGCTYRSLVIYDSCFCDRILIYYSSIL